MLVGQCGIASRKTGLAVNTKFTTAESWNDFTVGTPGGWGMLIGGGGAGCTASDGQAGASGAAVKVWMTPGQYRVWIGKKGIPSTAQNTDRSGYLAHGGAGGQGSGTVVGGQGGTPTILLKMVNNQWVIWAVAGAGGGGGAHINTLTARAGGGGAWFSHKITAEYQQIRISYNGISIALGSLAGGYESGSGLAALAGGGSTNTYNGAAGFSTTGASANMQDQWAGGNGGTNTGAERPGGGGGGGFGGGSGGAEGSGAGAMTGKPGGYVMVGSKRWGGTATGGGHNNICGSGGGGGGSYWPDDGRSGETVGSCVGLPSATDWRPQVRINNFYGLPVTTGQGGTCGSYSSTTSGADGGFVYTGSTVPF